MGKKKLSIDLIEKIRSLRQRGNSLLEISLEVSASKSTILRYIQGIEVLPEYLHLWMGKRGGSKRRQLIKRSLAENYAKDLITSLSLKEKLLFISALYWAEGSKSDFGLSNTDSRLIKVFVDGLREVFGVSDHDFKVSVRLYEDLDIEASLAFWSEIVGIPKNRFVSVNILKGSKHGKLKYGMCRVRVTKGGDLLKKVIAVNSLVSDLFLSP